MHGPYVNRFVASLVLMRQPVVEPEEAEKPESPKGEYDV